MSLPIEPDEILSALRNDSRYGHPHIIAQINKYIVRLPTELEEWLELSVTPRLFLKAKFCFLSWALRNGYHYNVQNAVNTYHTLADWIDEPSTAFQGTNTTEEQYMLSEHVGLFPLLRGLYEHGALTFNDLVRYQPSLFLP